MRRALAVLGAIVLVVAAMVVRNLIEDDGDGASADQRDGELLMVCDPDLRAYCGELTEADGLDAQIVEDSSVTSEGLVGGEPVGADVWITSADWFEVTANRAPSRAGTAEVLATTPVVVAADPLRADATGRLCADQRIWRCLADHAGEPWSGLGGQPTWGALKTGLPSADTATGLSALASVAIGHIGDADFAANDFDGSGFRDALTRLAEPSGTGDRDPLTTLVRRQGTYSAAGVLEARVARLAPAPPVLPTAPAVPAQIVLVRLPGGDEVPDLAATVRAALVDGGWAAGSGEPDGILKPGVLGALHDLWKEVTR